MSSNQVWGLAASHSAPTLPVRKVLRPGHAPVRKGQERWRTGRREQPVAGCTRQQGRLTVHLLKAKAFAAQFKNAVVIVLRSAIRVSFHQPAQSHRKLVT